MDECLFCQIAAGDEPAAMVSREDGVIAFRDKFPVAPVHILIMPEDHIPSVHALTEKHGDLLLTCFGLARRLAEEEGVSEGYRIATNVGRGGGQAIPHLHFHLIGGRQLGRIDSGEEH